MTHLHALQDGTELVGDYRIESVIGAGGFGITYLAQEPSLARRVTIKEYFPTDFAARDNEYDACPRSTGCAEDYKWGLDRFIEEAKVLARFDHPNIVRVYRYFRLHNTGYIVLKFEDGASFKSWLKSLGREPTQSELDRILVPLLDALELMHNAEFLHRDIAPDNIIVRKDGRPVLIDFGSARGDIAQHSRTLSALVKPGYSPYEQYAMNSRNQGPWTDIYALAATLYCAVCGKRPSDAPSRIVEDDLAPAARLAGGDYRPNFLAAIDHALRLKVDQRPQSIAAWRKELFAPAKARDRAATLRTSRPAKPQGAQAMLGAIAGAPAMPVPAARTREPRAAAAIRTITKAAPVYKRRTAPCPQPIRRNGSAGRLRPLLVKVLVVLAIAGAAAAIQDKWPDIEKTLELLYDRAHELVR